MTQNLAEKSRLGEIAGYTEVLAKNPQSTAFLSLCDAYRQMGLLDEALEVVRRGVAALPRFSPGHVMLGRLLVEKGDLDKAAEAFESALSLNPGSLPALKGLARLRYRRGDRGRARTLLQQADRLRPGDPAIQQMLLSLAATQDDPSSSVAAVSPPPPRTSSMKTAEPIATPTIADIYLRQGLPRRALQVYRNLLSAEPDNRMLRQKLEELEERIRQEEGQMQEEEPEACLAVQIETDTPGPSPLEVLTRWIEAIRRRRQHVQ